MCVSGVGCVDSGNLKGKVLRKIHSPDFRSSGFGISTTPPEDVRYACLKMLDNLKMLDIHV